MKPREFDELVRQKFDRNDFEYNPGNWAKLEDKMDERAKKRNVIMWWWMPLAGIAASVALAIGIFSSVLQHGNAGPGAQLALSHGLAVPQPLNNVPATRQTADAGVNMNSVKATHTKRRHTANKSDINDEDKNTHGWASIHLHAAPKNTTTPAVGFNFMQKDLTLPKKKEQIVLNEPVKTFKPGEEVKKVPKTSIMLSGGYNQGNQNTGYMIGASFRKMVNPKVFVESDVAFASSTNTQSTAYLVPVNYATAAGAGGGATAARHSQGARDASADGGKATTVASSDGSVADKDITYNLSYAEVSPRLGFQVMKKMSVGVGPDFQEVLADNRPAASTVERNNIQEAPMFDVGFIGKTEYSITKKIKAGLSYRKGINNIITPSDKYIDRDYLQFQVRCTIFNK